ncbi:MAG: type secretion protein Rhs, partial [Massilia sp.]|nr:type secretion protein Rhs [Massilia sp.]
MFYLVRHFVVRCTKTSSGIGLLFSVFSVTSSALAQTSFSEQSSLIKAPNAIARIGADLFGDSVNLYQGSLEFLHTDVSLRGNSQLPVAFQRRLVGGQQPYSIRQQGVMGNWQLDIPHLYGIFAAPDGWKTEGAAGTSVLRCSDFAPPPPAIYSSAAWDASEFWNGNYLHVP